ncbi:MAG: tubulin-like doman-containing protein, partial [Gemmataceae bacterium]
LIEKHSLQHLDVKPKNLFLISDRVKVADFGLVSAVERSSADGMMAGITPVYTSPETFQNKISKQSDQYSLAIVYHELLTGQRPYNGKNVRQLAMQHMTQAPNLELLPACDRPVVERALAKNPEDRYPSCLSFVRALIANSMADAASSNSLYNTSTGLRHVVASQAEFLLPDLVGKVSPVATTPAPLLSATPSTNASPMVSTPNAAPPSPSKMPVPAITPTKGTPRYGQPLVTPASAAAAANARPQGPSLISPASHPMARPMPGRPSSPSRRPESSHIDLSASSMRTESGILRPTLLIGVGSFGNKALQQIRARLLDRFGNLNRVPCFRFLLIDAEPVGSTREFVASPDIDLPAESLLNLPLQPTNNYRRRQLDQVLEWLPKERFYAIPRNLSVGGNRSYGRLAFCEHALKVSSRIKAEIQAASSADSLSISTEQSGLTVLTRMPAIHVYSSASGGTGGMLVDLGYCIRRSLDRAEADRVPVTSFVFAGAPHDVNTPAVEQSNILATLVELNHYSDEHSSFTAHFGGPEGVRVEERGNPFTASYLISMQERSKPAFDDCLANLAGYVTHDLTTPLGSALEKARRSKPAPGRTAFRQFGTFGLWYPRGLVIRTAARRLCAELVKEWANPKPSYFPPEIDQTMDRLLSDPRLTPASIRASIDRDSMRKKSDAGSPLTIVTDWLQTVVAEADSEIANNNAWIKAVMSQAIEYIGLEPSDEHSSKLSRGKLSIALDRGIARLTEQLGNELIEGLKPIVETPGIGLGACEMAIRQIMAACQATTNEIEATLREGLPRRTSLVTNVKNIAAGFDGVASSLSLFSGRSTRSRKSFGEKIKQLVEIRIEEDLLFASVRFYQKLSERLATRLHDITLCRQQLMDMYRELASPFTANESYGPNQPSGIGDDALAQTTLRMTNTIRIVLPNGEERVDVAAEEMLSVLTTENRHALHRELQKVILEPRGGIMELCKTVTNVSRVLIPPILEQTVHFLTEQLPTEDVTSIEATAARGRQDGFTRRVEGYLRGAAAHVTAPMADAKLFVTLPDSQSGRQFGQAVQTVQNNAVALTIPNYRSDLLFCREQDWMRQTDLRDLVSTCWDSYAEACGTVESSPHIRFDVPQWMPLIAEPAERW